MPTPVSPATFTISDTAPDGMAVFRFFILLINSLTICSSFKEGMLLCLPETKYSYYMQTLCLKASYYDFSKLFSYLYH